MICMKTRILALAMFLICAFATKAHAKTVFDDDEYPTAAPKMVVEDEEGPVEVSEYSGSAPLTVHFTSNVENQGGYTPLYEWRVFKDGNLTTPYLVRYDADFDFEFRNSGSSRIELQISFVNGADTLLYEMPEAFTVEVSTSVLNVPNAFSPNGDGINDVFRVKQDYKSIVEFHGYIFSRHGKKLFEWTDLTDGWDGTFHGSDVADGVYYVRIDAKGADGKKYNIKKAVNLLRGYTQDSTAGTE